MVNFETELGRVTIVTDVFTTLAGIAATNCFGVCGMAMRSVADGLVHLLKHEVMGKGVKIRIDKTAPSDLPRSPSDYALDVELHIITKTGVNLPVVCGNIIEQVSYSLQRDAGINVKSVDVCVDSIMADE